MVFLLSVEPYWNNVSDWCAIIIAIHKCCFCIFSCITLNNFYQLLVIIVIGNGKQTNWPYKQYHVKGHDIFTENFTTYFPNVGNLTEFEFIVCTNVHGKTTYELYTDDIWGHTSTYGWHTSDHTSDIRMTYEWHTNGARVHTDDLRTRRSDIRITYKWHTNDIQVSYEYIRMTYRLHTNDLRMT